MTVRNVPGEAERLELVHALRALANMRNVKAAVVGPGLVVRIDCGDATEAEALRIIEAFKAEHDCEVSVVNMHL